MFEEKDEAITDEREQKKSSFFDNLKKGGKKAGKWLKTSSKVVAEKADDVAIWARDAKDKAAILADEATETGRKIIDNIAQAKKESDYKILRPIFADDLSNESFEIPRMINICEMDEKRRKSPVCIDSIGFHSSPNNVEVLNIYRNNFALFNLTVFPDVNEGIYYANPSIPGTYISIEKYFEYINKEKVRELVRIARDLGAKRVIVELSTRESNADHKSGKIGLKLGGTKAEASAETAKKQSVGVNVGADEKWTGHNSPKMPELVYFKNENHIKDLIEMRFDPTNKLESHTFEIECASSASVRIKEAAKVDGALKAMKYSMSESMAYGAEQSERSYFKYTVIFD